jgi:anti-sigma factor RsiW
MNDTHPGAPCADYEHDVADLVDGELAPERARVVRLHLEACPRCRAWHASIASLDARLEAALPRPALSADFDRRLRDRIAAATRRAPSSEMRDTVDREYRSLLDGLRRRAGRRALLDGVAAAAVAGSVVAVAERWYAGLGGEWLSSLEGPARWMALGTIGTSIALGALAWAMRRYLPAE